MAKQSTSARRGSASRARWKTAHSAGSHAITFRHPGYISSRGPHRPLAPREWKHGIWSAERATSWIDRGPDELEGLTRELGGRLIALGAAQRAALEAGYRPPRFAHADCHAHQFFLRRDRDDWRVCGVVDMEVASAGDAEVDLAKFTKELAGRLPACTRWWAPLFDGYGREPAFELMKLRLAASAHITFKVYGRYSWPGSRAQIVRHLLDARDWGELYDPSRIPGDR